jgi:hypothetical protein
METIKQTISRYALNPSNCFGLELVSRQTMFVECPAAYAEELKEQGQKWISETIHVEYEAA